MKVQDLIKQIDEQAQNIEIPNSISPENMKKMLDENIGIWNTFDESNTDKTESGLTDQETSTGKKKHYIRRFTVAACAALCLMGGATALHINNKTLSTNSFQSTEAAMEYAAEEAAPVEEEKNADEFGEDLVYQSSLQSPSSYDAYYEVLTTAYKEYYDSISTVTNGNVEIYESVDMAEDSVVREESASLEEKESSKKDFSSTNTQENTVDEGDIIKTDGTYIYTVISKYNNDTGNTDQTLTITKTDNGNLEALSTIDLNELAEAKDNIHLDFYEFYLYQDYIVLMYTKEDYSTVDFTAETNIVLYDIKDKETPKKVKTLSQSGWYEGSRISNGFLYTISNFCETNLDTPTPYTNYIPSVNGKTVECSDIYYPRDILMQTTYVVTSLDLNTPTDFTDIAAIPTNGGQLYVSDSSIYFYTTLYDEVSKTEITKIRYSKGFLTPGESATVAGYLYDSFALSEYKNHLRIVATIPANNISLLRVMSVAKTNTTTNSASSNDIKIKEDVNVLYILDDNMKLTGKLSGIAPGERIYSARFMGDTGYFVTFKNVDPLFSVDLSDPSNPQILGQLKIPGFSNYLHLYNDGLLLGLGEEIDANTSQFLGLKLSMFNVSDPTNVTEQDKYVIEDSQYSVALYNHKAIMIDPEKNIFGFLYACCDDNSFEYTYYYATYTYDEEEGFIESARYPISNDSQFETDFVRSVYIGNYLYLATNESLTSYEIGSTQPIAQIYFK